MSASPDARLKFVIELPLGLDIHSEKYKAIAEIVGEAYTKVLLVLKEDEC